jgi:hypothetical protein
MLAPAGVRPGVADVRRRDLTTTIDSDPTP